MSSNNFDTCLNRAKHFLAEFYSITPIAIKFRSEQLLMDENIIVYISIPLESLDYKIMENSHRIGDIMEQGKYVLEFEEERNIVFTVDNRR